MFPEYGNTAMEDSEEEVADERASVEPADDLSRVISDAKRDCETKNGEVAVSSRCYRTTKNCYTKIVHGQKKLGNTLELLRWKAENDVTGI
jgi:hypothetical protein